MEAVIRELCVLSIFCGAALSLAPESRARKAMSFACSVVILACVVSGLRSLDLEEYAVQISLTREREQQFLAQTQELRDALDRLVIEREYSTYIMDTARQLRLTLQTAEVRAQWSLEGVWVPYSVLLVGEVDEAGRRSLADRIEADLGIPAERQEWNSNG